MTDPDSTKTIRTILRRIEDHRFHTHLDQGARHETLSMVEVLHHPASRQPELNYVMPRRAAAWVPINAVQEGIDRLKALDRRPRLVFIEGLLPPVFRKLLTDIGLQFSSESQIIACANLNRASPLPEDAESVVALSLEDASRWWRLRSALLGKADAGTTGNLSMAETLHTLVRRRRALLLTLRRDGMLAGIGSLELQPDLATARLVEAYTAETADHAVLLSALLRAASTARCDLVFGAQSTVGDGAWLGVNGFECLGAAVAYAKPP